MKRDCATGVVLCGLMILGGCGGDGDGGNGGITDAGGSGGGDAGPAGTGTAGRDGSTYSSDALNDSVASDASPPMDAAAAAIAAPANLNAVVLSRRGTTIQLTWDAPMTASGGGASGYQIRFASVPITIANFDDLSITTAVPYGGHPASPGQLDGLNITNLYVENTYYFAVAAMGVGNSRSEIVSTTMPTIAHLNVTQLTGISNANEQFGHSVSADGDLNGDGIADIAVGTLQSGKAYLFFGTAAFNVATPSVTFTGRNPGFGYTVAQVGDVDRDGRMDLAIADPLNAMAIYIYKGRPTWPMVLTDDQADYVIGTDTTYAGSGFGSSMAALGDFTGDGADDFAVGARLFGSGAGRVVIIPGRQGFGSLALPDTSNSIVIDADPALEKSYFGYRVLGIGHFYSVSGGTALIVSAPAATTSANATAGHVYAFHGQSGSNGVIPIAAADQVLAGPGAGARIGEVLANLGPIVNASPSVGVGNLQNTVDTPGEHGGAYVLSGNPSSGPFMNKHIVYLANANAGGGILLGGGLSGRDVRLSLIGDPTPDLVLGGISGSVLTISDGAKLVARQSPVEAGATAEVLLKLPAGWNSGEAADAVITDINGDGSPDFAIGSQAQPGAVLVFW